MSYHYLQAISVKFLPPTNTQGSRYKAYCDAGSLTVARDYSLSDNDQAAHVAKELIYKLGWHERGSWFGGAAKNGEVVFVNSHEYCQVWGE
jgi:hypothetical protein